MRESKIFMCVTTAAFVSITFILTASTAWGLAVAQEPVVETPEAEPERPDAPAVQFSTEEWDFGTKWFGEACLTEIVVSNVGKAPLKILKIRSSCGCTAAKPKRDELGPGESDTILVTYNTKKNKEIVSQTITFHTNDPKRPRVALQIKGIVKKVFDIQPNPRLTFGRIERNETAVQSIELRSNMDEPAALKLKPLPRDGAFDVKLEEVTPGKTYTLSATTRPPLPLGSSTMTIELDTGIERLPVLAVNVSAYIAPRVYVRPAKLHVSPSVTREFKRTVRVYYRADEPIEIKEARSSHPDLIKIEKLPPRETANPKAGANFHELRVTLPPGSQLPPDGGEIKIITNETDPEYQTFVIKVKLHTPKARPVEKQPASDKKSGQETPSPE